MAFLTGLFYCLTQRGHHVNGVWVFGGIEHLLADNGRNKAGRCFAMPVEKRDAATLIPLIKDNIAEGSIIHSDCWKAYNSIGRLPGYNYTHKTVDHSKGFKNTQGTHTNTIEGAWCAKFKMHISSQHYNFDKVEGQLFKCMWLNNWKGKVWSEFWSQMAGITFSEEHGVTYTTPDKRKAGGWENVANFAELESSNSTELENSNSETWETPAKKRARRD